MRKSHRNLVVEILAIVALIEIGVYTFLPLLAPSLNETARWIWNPIALLIISAPLIRFRVRSIQRSGVNDQHEETDSGNRLKVVLGTGLIVGFALTATAVHAMRSEIQVQARARFERLSERLFTETQRHFDTTLHSLDEIHTLCSQGTIKRAEFRAYVASHDLPKDFPGILGFAFVERVPRSEVDAFEKLQRADSAPDFTVRSSGAATDLYIIKYAEPLSQNLPALGWDAGSEPIRRAAIERAIQTGEPTISARVILQEAGSKRTGFVCVMPIFRAGTDPQNAQERQQALLGLVYAPVRVDEALAGLVLSADGKIHVELFQERLTSDASLVLDVNGEPGEPSDFADVAELSTRMFYDVRHFPMGEREWTVALATTRKFESAVDHIAPLLIGVGGVILCLTLAAIVWSLGRGRTRALALAREITADLSSAKGIAQNALRETEALRNALVDHFIVTVADPQGRIIEVNDAFCATSGYSRPELIGQDHRLINSGYHPQAFWAHMWQTVNAGRAWRAEVCNRAKNGALYWVDCIIAPFMGADGRIEKFVSIRSDITSRKFAEQKLVENEERIRLVIDTALDAVIAMDDGGNVTEWNAQAEAIFGWTHQDAVGRPMHELIIPQEFRAAHLAGLSRYKATGQTKVSNRRIEVPAIRKDGSQITIELAITPVRSAAGADSKVWFSAFLRDITDRKRAEQRIAESENRFRSLADSAPMFIWTIGPNARADYFNRPWLEFTGRTIEQAVGEGWLEAVHPEDRQRCRENYLNAFHSRQPLETEYRIRRHDGVYRMFLDRGLPLVSGDRFSGFVGACIDVTERRISELLRAGQASVLGMVATDAPLAETLAEVCRVTELHAPDMRVSLMLLEGDRLRSIAGPSLPPEYLAAIDNLQIGPEVGSCGAAAFLGQRIVVDNTQTDPKWAPFAPVALQYNLLACWSQPIFSAQGQVLGALAMYHSVPMRPDETQIRLIEESARLAAIAIERSRAQENMLTMLRDLTLARDELQQHALELNRRATEMERLRNAADAASQAKSEFLANMSHEIRTPLTAILGYADLLREDGEISIAPHRRLETIDTIRGAGQHLLTVINDILDLSKIEADRMTIENIDTPLAVLLQEIETFMRPRAQSKGVSLSIELTTPVPDRIMSDPTRLRQILMNLIGNAAKFTQKGSVTVHVRVDHDDHVQRIAFDVLDTGPGMTREQVARLFEAFSQADTTVTRQHGGTGLGLTISRRLARLMGGDVSLIWSEPGEGSRFCLNLPLKNAQGARTISSLNDAAPAPSDAPRAAAVSLSGRILLAEDGLDNQRLIAFHLRKAGAEVDIAENGRIALEKIDQAIANGKPYHLLVTDMQMPEMDGYTLARTVRARQLQIRIIALTAHAMSEDRQKCLDAGCNDYASKPIDKQLLLNTCQRWISNETGGDLRQAA